MESSEGPADGGDDGPEPSTPRNKVKFLCSYGGKIMPRPVDGLLKYVGGETRVISVSRDINFSKMMAKISSEFEKEMILKYQVMPDELDVLVTVRTDEDLQNMMEESDRQELVGHSKLRTFLFPSNPKQDDVNSSENRFYDAAIGSGKLNYHNTYKAPTPDIAKSPAYSSSGCSSPKSTSPESFRAETKYESSVANGYEGRMAMLKVQSTPNLFGHGGGSLHHYHNFNGGARPSQDHYHHLQAQHGSPFCRYDRGRASGGVSHGINHWYANKHCMGSCSFNKNAAYYHDEHCGYVCRAADRIDMHPQSPRSKFHE